MARDLVVDNVTYSFPEQGEDPTWGEVVVDWAEAMTAAINTLQGPADIPETTFTVANNQSVAANVTGLVFSSSLGRVFSITFFNPGTF